jgi:hypothetical protein
MKKTKMTRTVVVAMILAFLLFTPQGQFIAVSAIGLAFVSIFPPPAPIHHASSSAPTPDAST